MDNRVELILMRHGTTPGNLEGRFVGSTDQPLAPQGIALAQSVAPGMEPVEHLYRSPMLRCRQTAELLWPDMGEKTTVIDDLRETDFGPIEGKNNAELQDDPLYQKWLRGEIGIGEGVEDCTERAMKALAAISRDCLAMGYKKAAVVAHGGIFMSLLDRCGTPKRSYYDWLLPNCGGFRALLTPDPLGLEVAGSVGNRA